MLLVWNIHIGYFVVGFCLSKARCGFSPMCLCVYDRRETTNLVYSLFTENTHTTLNFIVIRGGQWTIIDGARGSTNQLMSSITVVQQ